MTDPWVLLVNMDERLRADVFQLAEDSGIDLARLLVHNPLTHIEGDA